MRVWILWTGTGYRWYMNGNSLLYVLLCIVVVILIVWMITSFIA